MKRRRFLTLLSAVIAAIPFGRACVSRLFSPVLYVDGANGDDGNDGLTKQTALASIQAAISKIKADYDRGRPRIIPIIIHLAAGTYRS